ncbi:endonuclease/exonuclease/phosphatase family protein [Streptomyces sp. PmtG]
MLRTDLWIRDTTVSFYNVHVAAQVDRSLSPFGTQFYRVIKDANARRKDQYAALAKDVDGNPYAAVVAGDFNTSPAMGDLRAIDSKLQDATLPSTGLNPLSWNSEGIELWRLDWAFTTDDLQVHRYRLLDPEGMSDHRAQQLTLSLTGED